MTDTSNFRTRSNVNQMYLAAIEFFDICEKNDVQPWLDYGGLLGMVRSGNLLPWNNDLHMCCFYKEGINKNMIDIVNDISNLGYLARYYPTVGALNIKKAHKDIDITLNIVWKQDSDAVRPHEEVTEFDNTTMWANPKLAVSLTFYWLARVMSTYSIFNTKYLAVFGAKEFFRILLENLFRAFPIRLRKKMFLWLLNASKVLGAKYEMTAIPLEYYSDFIFIEFQGSTIRIPKRSEDLLAYLYGDDWKTPKENWTFYKPEARSVSKMRYIKKNFNYESLDLL